MSEIRDEPRRDDRDDRRDDRRDLDRKDLATPVSREEPSSEAEAQARLAEIKAKDEKDQRVLNEAKQVTSAQNS